MLITKQPAQIAQTAFGHFIEYFCFLLCPLDRGRVKDSFQDHITHILCHLQEKQQTIKGLFSGECGEIFMRYLKEYLYQVFDRQLVDDKDIPREYRLNHAVSSFAETVRWWLGRHSEYTSEEIGRFYFESVDI